MRLLLDSHVVIWWLDGSPLSIAAEAAIRDPANEPTISVASLWELRLKQSKGRLRLPGAFDDFVAAPRIAVLDIRRIHADAIVALPGHHGDPFDRMLVAQAMVEGMTLVTRDRRLPAYGAPTILA